MGGFLAAVGSSKEALALYERKFKRLICVQRVQKVMKSKEVKEIVYLPGIHLEVLRELRHAFI